MTLLSVTLFELRACVSKLCKLMRHIYMLLTEGWKVGYWLGLANVYM